MFTNRRVSPFGVWGAPAHSQLTWRSLMQLASVFGLAGITFLLAWTGAVVASCWHRGLHAASSQRQARLLAAVVAVVLTFGGMRVNVLDGRFFQQPLQATIPSQLSVACVVANDSDHGTFMQQVETRIAASAQLVLMSEESGQDDTLDKAKALSAKTGAWIGVAYARGVAGGRSYNSLALVTPGDRGGGEVAFQVDKKNLVVGLENGITPGDASHPPVAVVALPEATTPPLSVTVTGPTLRVGGAICHDFDHPDYIRGSDSPDLMP
jgi:apolipoprotein N-acyltransferase